MFIPHTNKLFLVFSHSILVFFNLGYSFQHVVDKKTRLELNMTTKRATYPHYNFKTNTQFLIDNGKIKYSKHQIYSKDIKFYSVQF